MVYRRSPVVQGLLVVAIAAAIGGCAPSKVSQCNKLSASVNKIRPISEKVQQEGKNFEAAARAAGGKNDLKAFKDAAGSSANAFNGLIGQLNGLIQDVQRIELKDETLIALKAGYVQNANAINASFQEISNALTTISKIENSPKGLQQLQLAANSLTQTSNKMNGLVQEESRMVAEFNQYCGNNK